MPKYYDRDTKVAYVQQIEEGKLKASQAARDLGVAEQTICNWIKEFRTDSKVGLPGSGHQKLGAE
jgi:transposase-like protein